jgi:hypothetical protein
MLKFLTIACISSLLFLSGCGGSPKDKGIAAYVNKEPIYASELDREIALKVKQDPSFRVTKEAMRDQLDLMINKKLIIQESMAAGLAREDRFVNTIKGFWEQTLIRDFIDYKNREFKDYLFATEDEIKKYYAKMAKRMTFKVLKSEDKEYIRIAHENFLKDPAESAAWETIGPVVYEDSSAMLADSFELKEGSAKRFDDEPYFYIVKVEKIEPVTLEPLEVLRPEIEERIIADKERSLFDKWLKEKRKKSRIKIEL